ncbi:hypothetical protein [Halalkalicoccus subterraneus]|uniref:hypothetical protein n=1 Tax=Halalkalicoccus subterraneus TaxID=2675002 RepID=UPI000EFCE36C|nr:hypothetical protein [Halalkalicoccus subterraneus]
MSEERLAHLTEWARKRPNSIEFWEVFLMTERVVCCFAGESFSSALLRADMGGRAREELVDLAPEDLLAHNERNVRIPLADLESITLVRGTLFRRARLTLAWDGGELALYNTKAGDSQESLLESLAEDPRIGISIEITDPSSILNRS